MGWDSGEIRTADDLCTFLRKWVTDESIRTCWECKQEAACFCRVRQGLGHARSEAELGEREARRL